MFKISIKNSTTTEKSKFDGILTKKRTFLEKVNFIKNYNKFLEILILIKILQILQNKFAKNKK